MNRPVTRRFGLAALVAGLLLAGHFVLADPTNTVTFTMPATGYATIAIDNADGVRVRNLVGSGKYPAGPHMVEWDGRDDNGKSLPPGAYRWVGLSRGDLHAVYRGSFQYGTPPWLYGKTGGWTADHSAAGAVTAAGDLVLLGSLIVEWGHGLIATDLDGRKLWGTRWLDKRAWSGVEAMVTLGDKVFASSFPEAYVWEINPRTGDNHLVLEPNDLPTAGRKPALRIAGGRADELFLADLTSPEPHTLVFSTATKPLKLLRTLPVRAWSLAWLPDGRCVAALDYSLAILDTETGQTTPFVENLAAPWGLAADARGRVFVSDQGGAGIYTNVAQGELSWRYLRERNEASNQIKIFDNTGHLLRTLGQKGGQPLGAIDPESFWQPAGLAFDARGRLWITEFTQSPKRVTVWEIPEDVAKDAPKLIRQFLGPCMYGGGAIMVDPKRPWELADADYGVVFNMNLPTGTYVASRLPWRHYNAWKEGPWRPDLPFCGRPGIVYELAGRHFAACSGGYGHGADARWEPYRFLANGPVMIGEYRGDVFVPLAAIGNIRMWLRDRELLCRREDQWLSPVVLEAARRVPDWPRYAAQMKMAPDAPDVPHVTHVRGSSVWIASPWPQAISGFLWVDANGDGRVQPEEISFHEFPDTEHVTLDDQLNAYLTADHDRDGGVYKLARDGFNKVGAPVYKWDNLQKISDDKFEIAQVGKDGTLLSFDSLRRPDGTPIWSYPIAPHPQNRVEATQPGHIYRINAMRGVVTGPGDLGDVYQLGSVDGTTYLLTRNDGLFIARVFQPFSVAPGWDTIPEAKPGMLLDNYSLQEECFNGHFARATVSGQGFEAGHYYMVGLGRSAVVELTGLDSVKRFAGGPLQLSQEVGVYARGGFLDPAPAVPVQYDRRKPRGPLVATAIKQGQDAFAGKAAQFASATVWAAWDKRGLHMKWVVTGNATSFVNNGDDWTLLFSTGDACDLQIQSPTLGKCRYIFTMFKGKPIVVRLRYDAKEEGQGIVYKSGVAETRVPVVEQLDLKLAPRQTRDGYVVQVTLPWDTLGIQPASGLQVPAELGVFYADPTGNKLMAREYWNSATSETVSDVPAEARPTKDWGTLQLQ